MVSELSGWFNEKWKKRRRGHMEQNQKQTGREIRAHGGLSDTGRGGQGWKGDLHMFSNVLFYVKNIRKQRNRLLK